MSKTYDMQALMAYAEEMAVAHDLVLFSEPDVELAPTLVGRAVIDMSPVTEVVNGVRRQKKVYRDYVNMMNRCYNPDDKYYKQYKGVTVCEEWFTLSNYWRWHKARYIADTDVDKDLLVPGNKVYSPHTCCFLSHELNTLIQNTKDYGAPDGEYTLKRSVGHESWLLGKKIGSHTSAELAYIYWLFKRADAIDERMPTDNVRVIEALTRLVAALRAEAEELDKKNNLFKQEVIDE